MAKRTQKAEAPTPVSPAVNDDVAAGRQHVQAQLATMTAAQRKQLQRQQQTLIGQPVGTTIPWTQWWSGRSGQGRRLSYCVRSGTR